MIVPTKNVELSFAVYLYSTFGLPHTYLALSLDQRSFHGLRKSWPLPQLNIVWFNPTLDPKVIIDHCGEFNNVPLLGGGISYNSVLARCQFGYPMKMNPLYLILDRDFFFYKEDVGNKKAQFVQA